MKTIAFGLLIVAVMAIGPITADVGTGSVTISDAASKAIGAINFEKVATAPDDVKMYINIWGVPEGDYILVLQKSTAGTGGATTAGPAFVKKDPTSTVPMALYKFHKDSAVETEMKVTETYTDAKLSMKGPAEPFLVDSFVALYQSTPTTILFCTKSTSKLAKPLGTGKVSDGGAAEIPPKI